MGPVYALTDAPRVRNAGDQLYVDLDVSAENLPPGTRLAVDDAELEVRALPHTGCATFVSRFDLDAMRFVNSVEGRVLHLHAIYARVVRPGSVRVGDRVRKRVDRAPRG